MRLSQHSGAEMTGFLCSGPLGHLGLRVLLTVPGKRSTDSGPTLGGVGLVSSGEEAGLRSLAVCLAPVS